MKVGRIWNQRTGKWVYPDNPLPTPDRVWDQRVGSWVNTEDAPTISPTIKPITETVLVIKDVVKDVADVVDKIIVENQEVEIMGISNTQGDRGAGKIWDQRAGRWVYPEQVSLVPGTTRTPEEIIRIVDVIKKLPNRPIEDINPISEFAKTERVDQGGIDGSGGLINYLSGKITGGTGVIVVVVVGSIVWLMWGRK